jgi:hypothetical protein
MAEHIVQPRTYIVIFLALMALTAVTVAPPARRCW